VTELPTFDWITEPQAVPAALKKLKPDQVVVCIICRDKRRGSHLTHEATAQEHIAEIESLMSRQAMGRYTIAEIAKILAQENNLDEMKLLPRLQEATNDKKLAVTDPDTGGTPIAPNAQILIFNQWVHPKAVNALLASWDVNYQFGWPRPWHLQAAESALGNVQSSAVPIQRTTAQDTAILEAIKTKGYEAKSLPKSKPGKSGVKATVRAAVATNPLFQGTVFNKAWDRLRKSGEIADAI
jgi:hypothetical protein